MAGQAWAAECQIQEMIMRITLEDLEKEKEKDPQKLAEEDERARQQAERDSTWEDTKSLARKAAEEKEKFSQMSGQQKLSYFRSYYLLPCVGILLGIFFAGTMIRDIIRGSGEILISGMLLNTYLTDGADEPLKDDYLEYLGKEGAKVKGKARVDLSQYSMDLTDGEPGAGYIQVEMAVVTRLSAGSVDFILADESAYEYLGSHGMMCDPQEALTKETFEKYRDHIVYREVAEYIPDDAETLTTETENTDQTTMAETEKADRTTQIAAFSLAGTRFGEEFLKYPEADQAYLVLLPPKKDTTRVERFLDYLFMG